MCMQGVCGYEPEDIILTVSVPTGPTDQGVMPTSSQVEESAMAGVGTYDIVKDPKV